MNFLNPDPISRPLRRRRFRPRHHPIVALALALKSSVPPSSNMYRPAAMRIWASGFIHLNKATVHNISSRRKLNEYEGLPQKADLPSRTCGARRRRERYLSDDGRHGMVPPLPLPQGVGAAGTDENDRHSHPGKYTTQYRTRYLHDVGEPLILNPYSEDLQVPA